VIVDLLGWKKVYKALDQWPVSFFFSLDFVVGSFFFGWSFLPLR